MAHTLISFLGKSQQNKTTGYRTANYDLNQQLLTTAFLGVELAKHLKPQKLLLIGTAGSMWDVFFEQHADNEHILNLIDATANNCVDEHLLKPCIPQIEQQLGCEVECIVIQYARNEAEQVALLSRIAQSLQENDRISIDVTHSFRHLPMLALVASRFLQNVKNIQTEHIYYGALEMTENERTPVIELDGLLKMLNWVDALSVYNHDGSYQVFADLFRQEQADLSAELLEKAAFYENTNQIHQARAPLTKFRKIENNASPLIQLFTEELKKRTAWAEQNDYASRQLKMAEFYLQKRDYLRAGILAQEAWVSKMVQRYTASGEQSNYDNREMAQEHFKQVASKNHREAFKMLNLIRNALAHGTQAYDKGVQNILSQPDGLLNKLKNIMQTIKNW